MWPTQHVTNTLQWYKHLRQQIIGQERQNPPRERRKTLTVNLKQVWDAVERNYRRFCKALQVGGMVNGHSDCRNGWRSCNSS